MTEFSKTVEYTVRREEIGRYVRFLLFPHCFHKTCIHVKTRTCLGKGSGARFTKIVTNIIFVSFYVSLKKVRKCVLLKKCVSDSSVSFCVTLRTKKTCRNSRVKMAENRGEFGLKEFFFFRERPNWQHDLSSRESNNDAD